MDAMNPEERKEFLKTLAKRLQESAYALNKMAGKMDVISANQAEMVKSIGVSAETLERNIFENSEHEFTYLEYLEFSGSDEFKFYKHMGPITDEDIANVNWDELSSMLAYG
jgi:hypothetical protein